MKTLLITQDFPPLLGGIANYYYNRVNKMNHEEIVVLADNSSCNVHQRAGLETSAQHGVRYKNFYTKYIWPHWIPLIWHIYRVVKKEKIKMLWVGQVIPIGTAAVIANKFLRLSYFVTCHGNDLLRAKLHPRKYKLAKKILCDADFIEANTNFTKNILINDFNINQDKIKVVYPECSLSRNQVDENKIKQIKDKYNLHNKKVLITVARLVKSKGIENIIKALPDDLNLVYLIIGDGPDNNRLQQIVSGLKQVNKTKIIFIGPVVHSELPNYYALADAFILTANSNNSGDTESFGIVYLEAAAFGLPIIAGDTGGVKEIKNEKMTLVNSEDVNEIKKNIVKWLNG